MEKLTPILPCRSRDDASEPRSPVQAEELLAAWTALWHPALIAAARAMPKGTPASLPPDDPQGHLLLIPPTAEPLVPEDWWDHAEQLGAQWIRGQRSRPEMIAAVLAKLESPPEVDADLVADFLALGFCHYVIETITVNIRYTNSLDENAFEAEAVAAAVAACGGDDEEAREKLQAAFDLLHTAREYSYPSDSHLLDLTLVADSTLGASLRAELSGRTAEDAPCNLLISGQVLQEMALRELATLDLLRRALQEGTASLVGGEFHELELPLLPLEAVRAQLVRGLSVYEEHLGARPTVFGRRRFGMAPLLPQILENLGFTGAIHATLDDGHFPTASASRQSWEGLDGTAIEAMLRVPIDASRAEGFVRLPHAISGAADMDYQPTAAFAHWPSRTSCWYEDIQRARRFTDVLGTFRSLPAYFEQTGMSGHQTIFPADDYRSPYLAQAVAAGEADAISRWQRYYVRRAIGEAAATMNALARIVGGRTSTAVDNVLEAIDDSLRVPADAKEIDDALHAAIELGAGDLAEAVGGQRYVRLSSLTENSCQAGKPDVPAGLLVINPLSFSRRARVDVSDSAIVEVPPLGFAVVQPGVGAKPPQPKRGFSLFRRSPPPPRPLAEKNSEGGAVLRNEFFEAVIDPHLGAIRAVYDFRSRGPRVAQQIAMRLHGGEDDDAYSIMTADEIQVVEAGPVVGTVAVRGRLMARDGQRVADFRQTTRVTWGSRVLEIEVEIDPHREPSGEPWNSYYAARFAWGQDLSKLYRGVNQATIASEAVRLESPQFVELRAKEGRTTLLTAGLPYHRRSGLRKLDSLLIVRGETARRFRFGIGLDLPQPQAAALDFLTPSPVVPLAAFPKNDSGWLFHLDNRGVVATHWEPILESGAVVGTLVRLLETEGRQTTLGLRSFRPLKSALKQGGGNRPPVDLHIAGDLVTVPLRPYEWAEVDLK